MPLIGNKLTFAFELLPVTPSWERRYAPERGPWAATAIWVGGQNLCRNVLPGAAEIREYLNIPLSALADWFVTSFPFIEFEERPSLYPISHDLHQRVEQWGGARPPSGLDEDEWFDAREAWWRRHFLRAGADGARVPNLAFARANEQLVVNWAQPRFIGDDAPRLLSPNGEWSAPWAEGREVIDEFVAQVAVWLREVDMAGAYHWAAMQRPLTATKPKLRDAIEYFTARPVSELEALFRVKGLRNLLRTLGLSAASEDPAASPQCQMLRDLSPNVGTDIGALLLEAESASHGNVQGQGWLTVRPVALDAARSAVTPEEAGQLAASEVRSLLGLNGQPIASVGDLLADLHVDYEHSNVRSQHDRMIVTGREGSPGVVRTLQSPRTENSWGQRFEAGRALGHLLLDPIRVGVLGAASGPFTEETRRRRSGAFSAELLLPESALAAASHNELDGATREERFKELLNVYNIGARTAAHQLWNRGFLSSGDVRDELIERFGAAAPR